MKMQISRLENLIFLLPVAFLLAVICFAVRNYSPVPFLDSWHGFYDSGFFEVHNEGHRISLTRLVFLLDHHVFKSHFAVLIALNVVLMCALFFLFVHLAKKRLGRMDVACISLSGCWIFFLVQEDNIYWEFQSQVFFSLLAPLMAFIFLGGFLKNGKRKSLYASMVFAILANFSMGNGFLAAAIIFPWLFYKKTNSFDRFIVFFAFILPPLMLLLHQPATGVTQNAVAGFDFFRYVKYCISWLGSPFHHISQYLGVRGKFVVYVSGCVFIAIFLFHARRLLKSMRQKTVPDHAALILLCFMLYIIFTACLTGIARYQYGTGQAVASRYATFAIAGWVALFILCWPKHGSRRTLNACAICLMLAMMPFQFHKASMIRQFLTYADAFMATMIMDVENIAEVENGIHFAPEYIAGVINENKKHPGFFTNSARYEEIRNFLSGAYLPDFKKTKKCEMDMVAIDVKNAHRHIYGWLKYHPYDGKPHILLAYDRNLEKSGFISLGIPRPDISRDEVYAGFIGLTHENSFPGEWYLHDPGNGFSCKIPGK